MDESFLSYYESELSHLRNAGKQFAAEYPKVAARLQLGEDECADPFVERLLEGVAFLTARIARKMDDGLADFSEQLLQQMAPAMVAPLVSRTVLQITRAEAPQDLLPAGTDFRVPTTLPGTPDCRFNTREDLVLSHLTAQEASYLENSVPALAAELGCDALCALRTDYTAGASYPGGTLRLFVAAPDSAACELMELLCCRCSGVVAESAGRRTLLPPPQEDVAVPEEGGGLPLPAEYFAQQAQLTFLKVEGLPALQEGDTLSLTFLLRRQPGHRLQLALGRPCLLPDCVRAINAFPQRLARFTPSTRGVDLLVPEAPLRDRYEVLWPTEGAAYSEENERLFDIYPFYTALHRAMPEGGLRLNYIATHREKPVARPIGRVSSYPGDEVFARFSGPLFSSMRTQIAAVALRAVCSNRDLPLFVRRDSPLTTPPAELPAAARFAASPTPPQPPLMRETTLWLGLALLRLTPGALASYGDEVLPGLLRKLLHTLHAPDNAAAAVQLKAIRAVQVGVCTHTIPVQGDLCTLRGRRFTITLNEDAAGSSALFLFARSLAAYLFSLREINTTMEVSFRTASRELWTWQQRPTDP